MSVDVDVVVVGAGPAGSCAATVLARAGHSVVLVERGAFPGAKNMYGGVVYPRILDQLHPEWWDEAPVQRWITRRSTMILTDDQALTVDFRAASWGRPPYNGATAYRPDWDHWLASKAEADGAHLVCSTTVTGLLRDERGVVVGVATDRPDGDITARVVISCDGVNSFLAKEAGLYGPVDAANYTLGVKETLGLPKDVIDERFAVRGREGVDIEILGGTGGVNGGGFVYTNLDTVSVGVVLKLPKLAAQQRRPEEIIADLKTSPGARSTRGGRRGQGVLGPPDPRGRSVDDAEDDRGRPARGGRRGGDVPRRGDLARRGQLRDGERHVRGRGRGRSTACRLTRRPPGSPATSDGSATRSCCATTASCAGPRRSSCPTGCSTSIRR